MSVAQHYLVDARDLPDVRGDFECLLLHSSVGDLKQIFVLCNPVDDVRQLQLPCGFARREDCLRSKYVLQQSFGRFQQRKRVRQWLLIVITTGCFVGDNRQRDLRDAADSRAQNCEQCAIPTASEYASAVPS